MLANTTKLPSEKMKTSDKRRHMLACSRHTNGIGMHRIIESFRMLSAPVAMKASFSLMHDCNRHQ